MTDIVSVAQGGALVPLKTGDALWIDFREAYARALEGPAPDAPQNLVSAYVLQLAGLAFGAGLVNAEVAFLTRSPLPAHLERRGRRLAVKLIAAFASAVGGLRGELDRSARLGGFESFRNQLEDHGLTRAVAWRLCLALRDAGLLRAKPDRPYLNQRGMFLARRLLEGTGVRPHSAREWEAALILEADWRLATGRTPARLDAEAVTQTCAMLAK